EYLQVYTSLYRVGSEALYGFDWVGPLLQVSHLDAGGDPDSTAIVEMDPFCWSIWTGRVHAWEAGSYQLQCSGYDSLGVRHEDSRQFAVGFAGSGKLTLDIDCARLEAEEGSVPPGSMVSLSESGVLGVCVGSIMPLAECRDLMTGVLEGPVAIPDVTGLLSFPAETPAGAVYRLEDRSWERQESCWQAGRIVAHVGRAGVYVLGEGPGVVSPRVPDRLALEGSSPNPFRTESSIHFSVPESCPVRLLVYDITGRLVATILCGERAPGRYSIVWDGRSDSGVEVAAGVYFCRLEALGQSLTLKLVRVGR
ncbi:hypothetical protein JW921_02085, partial [Candidatus Fermentibacterales bacterium]|nr:hypothetical protein [Candidatus Fermentibacterales bacterium]